MRWLIFLLLVSCAEKITVLNGYVTKKNLASYHVGTPDPRLDCPDIGQRLTIHWSLSDHEFSCYDEVNLVLTMRYENREVVKKELLLCDKSGSFTFSLLNDEYVKARGIQTYKVDIFGDGEPIACWRHQLWTELIVLN